MPKQKGNSLLHSSDSITLLSLHIQFGVYTIEHNETTPGWMPFCCHALVGVCIHFPSLLASLIISIIIFSVYICTFYACCV